MPLPTCRLRRTRTARRPWGGGPAVYQQLAAGGPVDAVDAGGDLGDAAADEPVEGDDLASPDGDVDVVEPADAGQLAQLEHGWAVEAVRQGECVVVYPEGTLTRDPDLWPMAGKSGAARIALATGAPVIPVGQWGAHEVLPPYTKRPKLVPRKRVVMKVGDPVDLADLTEIAGEHPTAQIINQATARIMAALVAIVEELRGEQAPAERFDPRRAGVQQIGNPRKQRSDDGKGTS